MSAGLTETALALAILLSVIVRWIRSGSSWGAIDAGEATAEVLRDVTGILERDKLQEAFGPPRLEDGVFPVTRQEVLQARTGIGYLLGDRWLDGASAIIALCALIPVWPIWGTRVWLELLVAFAAFYQLAGWIASLGFVRRQG
jgi:hypothetical protein